MVEYQKNQEVEVVVNALGNEGEGVGHTQDGYTVFVKDALPGDVIRHGKGLLAAGIFIESQQEQ